jgi:hypothetical protein
MQAPPSARPMGITILAVLAAIAGIFGLLGGLVVLGIGGALIGSGVLGGLIGIIGLVVLVVAIGELAFAYGAWMLKPWAWTLGLAVEIVSIISAILYILAGTSIGSEIVSIVIALAILYYLDTPAVRSAFGKPATSWFAGMMKR